jgi:hypothetical protein
VERRLHLGDLHLSRDETGTLGVLLEPAREEGLALPYSPRTAWNAAPLLDLIELLVQGRLGARAHGKRIESRWGTVRGGGHR